MKDEKKNIMLSRNKFLIIIILILLCSLNIDTSASDNDTEHKFSVVTAPTGYENNHALIIGIGTYDEWAKLESPPKDAKEIARILTEKYDFKYENITLLTDDTKDKPTLINIISALQKYRDQLTDKDNLLIFYSGHSAEDENDETYWIPKDANKKLKVTWLKHSDICKEYLANEQFKAKNVAVITDSLFSKTLLEPTSIALSPYDLEYTAKIMKLAEKQSREVISFGEKHWDVTPKTEGYGLFTYYFRKALINNWFKVIDLENLIFEEDTILQVRQVAGTRLVRGRLKDAAMEKGGQTIITRVVSLPAIDVTEAYVSPKKGYISETFTVEAVTSRAASEVYIELGGKKYLMNGEGTEWKHSIKVASVGPCSLRVFSINEDDIEGASQMIEITVLAPVPDMVNIASASVNPQKGKGGDEFLFTAQTSASAKKVALIIGDKRYDMTGSGTDWSLKQKVEETGSVTYSIVAVNDAGIDGMPKNGLISITADDTSPPKITISYPSIKRGIITVSHETDIIIEGQATDENGISNIYVNAKKVNFDQEGYFTTVIDLVGGANQVVINALDLFENMAMETYKITSEKSVAEVSDKISGKSMAKYYALIIGNNDYKYLDKLKTAKNDAKNIGNILEIRYGFNVKFLLDATRDDILTYLNNYRKNLTEDDNLLIYYAGHGEFDEITNKSYWLPVDAKNDDNTNWIISDQITSNIQLMSSKHVLIISDSCYSGTLTRGAFTNLSPGQERSNYLEKMLQKRSRSLMSSGGNEPVLDAGGKGHSVFAEALIIGLEEIEDSTFLGEELFHQYIKERVAGNAEQTPNYDIINNSGHDGGDFIFVRSD